MDFDGGLTRQEVKRAVDQGKTGCCGDSLCEVQQLFDEELIRRGKQPGLKPGTSVYGPNFKPNGKASPVGLLDAIFGGQSGANGRNFDGEANDFGRGVRTGMADPGGVFEELFGPRNRPGATLTAKQIEEAVKAGTLAAFAEDRRMRQEKTIGALLGKYVFVPILVRPIAWLVTQILTFLAAVARPEVGRTATQIMVANARRNGSLERPDVLARRLTPLGARMGFALVDFVDNAKYAIGKQLARLQKPAETDLRVRVAPPSISRGCGS